MKTKKHIEELLHQYRKKLDAAVLCSKFNNISMMRANIKSARVIERRIIDAFDEGERAIAKVNALKDREAIEFLDSLGL